MANPEMLQPILSHYALRRPGTPEEVANMVLYLASDEAGWVTGGTFTIDGGMTISKDERPMDINATTQFCGVIGNPVEHSLSPAIHNAAFQKLGLNFVYLAWKVEAIGDAVKGLRALGNFRGASVTIPHKVAVLPFLDEVEATARHIGAINTIVAQNGRLLGINTDATGALRALKQGNAPVSGEPVIILGSGGARARHCLCACR